MIKRQLLEQIIPWLHKKKIILIKGMRQVGKTTLLGMTKDYLINEIKIAQKQILFFSIDFEINNPIFEDGKLFVKYIREQYLTKTDYIYIFLDEFQYLKNPGLFLKTVFDAEKDNIQIIVTGSSSLEISKTKEFLTGRKIEFVLSQLSFFEFLSYNSSNSYSFVNSNDSLDEFIKIYGIDLKTQLISYLQYGGYPEVVTEENKEYKKILLKEIISTYIRKDITGFLKIENINGFNNLVKILITQIGNLLNRHELSNTLGLNIITLKKYLTILEETMVFSFLPPYHTNIRKELSKMKKIYVNDLGIRNFYLDQYGMSYDTISGSLIENFIFTELQNKIDKEKIFFYRTIAKAEIDFVILSEGRYILIESKFVNSINKNIPEVMKNFEERYTLSQKIIITKDYYKKENNLLYLPVYLFPLLKLEEFE